MANANEKHIDQMTREEMDQELNDFLVKATPNELSEFIDEVQNNAKYGKCEGFINVVKALAVRKMLKQLDAYCYTSQRVKGNKTRLHINMQINDICLMITKKDSKNIIHVLPKLYDQHKDELLQIIEAQKEAGREKEVALR